MTKKKNKHLPTSESKSIVDNQALTSHNKPGDKKRRSFVNQAFEPILLLPQKEKLFKKVFFWTSLVLLLAMPIMSLDYGITGDELVHKTNGENVIKYLETGGQDTTYRHYKNLYLYGGLFDGTAAFIYQNIGGDPYKVRHCLNAVFGAALIITTGLLAREVAGSWLLALLTLLFTLLNPRLFGDSMNNPKDIPFAFAYALSIFSIIRFNRFLPKWNWQSAIILFFAIAIALNIRIGGLLLLAYFGLYTFVNLTFYKRIEVQGSGKSTWSRLMLYSLILGIVSFLAGIIFFPFAHSAPVKNSLAALKEMENFQTAIRMLFEGRALWSDEIPWYYIPKWLGIALPLFILAGIGLFFVLVKKAWRGSRHLPLLFVLFVAIFPVAYAIYKHSALYDGIRHFLFIMPVLTVLAAIGWGTLSFSFLNGNKKWITPSLLGILLLLPLRFMIANHPNEYVYFNELEGGIKGAHGYYETDYWMNSIKPLSEWIINNDPRVKKGDSITVVTNSIDPAKYYFNKLAPKVGILYANWRDRYKYKADYYMSIPRFIDKDLLQNGAWPPYKTVKTVTVDGVPIGAVSQYPDTLMYALTKVNASSELNSTLALAEKIKKREPKNEILYLTIANYLLSIEPNQLDLASKYLTEGLDLAPDHPDLLLTQGLLFIKQGKLNEAYVNFEKCTTQNYRNVSAYYYKAFILMNQKDYSTALDQANLAIKYAPSFKPAYQLAAQILQSAGDMQGAQKYIQAQNSF